MPGTCHNNKHHGSACQNNDTVSHVVGDRQDAWGLETRRNGPLTASGEFPENGRICDTRSWHYGPSEPQGARGAQSCDRRRDHERRQEGCAVPRRQGCFPPKMKAIARVSPSTAFINVPYDDQFQDLYLALIAGLAAFGLDARATLEVPGGARRLDRVFELITSCQYSIHDLSRVQLDRKRPRTPRFNMPFELGLVLGWLKTNKTSNHTWFVFESVKRRVSKSLSDLDGTDPYIHDARPKGVFRELGNALVRSADQPTVQQMTAIYRNIKKAAFEARVFGQLVVLARKYAELARTAPRRGAQPVARKSGR